MMFKEELLWDVNFVLFLEVLVSPVALIEQLPVSQKVLSCKSRWLDSTSTSWFPLSFKTLFQASLRGCRRVNIAYKFALCHQYFLTVPNKQTKAQFGNQLKLILKNSRVKNMTKNVQTNNFCILKRNVRPKCNREKKCSAQVQPRKKCAAQVQTGIKCASKGQPEKKCAAQVQTHFQKKCAVGTGVSKKCSKKWFIFGGSRLAEKCQNWYPKHERPTYVI